MSRVASSTTTSVSPAIASSYAAVRPAGPAPMMSTRERIRLVPREQEKLAQGEIEAEHGAGRAKLRDLVRKRCPFHARINGGLIERHAAQAHRGEDGKLGACVAHAPRREHPSHAEEIDDRQASAEPDRRRDQVVDRCEANQGAEKTKVARQRPRRGGQVADPFARRKAHGETAHRSLKRRELWLPSAPLSRVCTGCAWP